MAAFTSRALLAVVAGALGLVRDATTATTGPAAPRVHDRWRVLPLRPAGMTEQPPAALELPSLLLQHQRLGGLLAGDGDGLPSPAAAEGASSRQGVALGAGEELSSVVAVVAAGEEGAVAVQAGRAVGVALEAALAARRAGRAEATSAEALDELLRHGATVDEVAGGVAELRRRCERVRGDARVLGAVVKPALRQQRLLCL